MRVSRLFLVGVSFLLIAACGGGSGATQQPTTRPSTPTGGTASPGQPGATPTQPPVSGQGTSVAHVEIMSGPLTGTYDETGIKYDCNTSPTGVGATFLDLAQTDGLSNLTFTSGEGGANPTKIYFQALFRKGGAVNSSGPEIVTLVPASARGSGTTTIEDKGSTLKVTVDGTGHDGSRLKATVECGPVDRR